MDKVSQSTIELEIGLNESLAQVQQKLLAARNADGHWTGRLATSALSTATAVSALTVFARSTDHEVRDAANAAANRGLAWLDAAQNVDGGFGDTDRSPSNIASSFLALAAWTLATDGRDRKDAIGRLQASIDSAGGWAGLRRRYGKDKTFVVPILSNCAIAGLVPWSRVPSLPFELAAFPQSMYRFLQMPVVSYAIPALVAIGQARFHHAGTWNPVAWAGRRMARNKAMKVLLKMQPDSGGYLEATPLTSFVLMNLASMEHSDHAVSLASVRFLLGSQLPDGSWPIDENLATWLTSLSVSALSHDSSLNLKDVVHRQAIDWLLKCRHQQRHPFTGAEPGGWGWTDLSGAVPDADDTPAAMLALAKVCQPLPSDDPLRQEIEAACRGGVGWLLGLQNRDGGWPTFCRGWGKLPFDRSGSDLTAHALRALHVWKANAGVGAGGRQGNDTTEHPHGLATRRDKAIERGLAYLAKTQRDDGSWLPLWFGNHDNHDDENPVYGTARVLLAYETLGRVDAQEYQKGCSFLIKSQNSDGGWGGGPSVNAWLQQQGLPDVQGHNGQPIVSTVEETAVAMEALAGSGIPGCRATIIEGVQFLQDAIATNRCEHPWPIGFYFAKLWYHEQLYPLVLTTAALGKVKAALKQS